MIRRFSALVTRRRVLATGVAGMLVGIAAIGSPALAYFSNTTSSQTMSIGTTSYSCFTRTPADNPWFYYAYDQPSTTSLTDSSGNGNTGTNNGSTEIDGTCAGGSTPYFSVGSANGVANYYGGYGAVSPQVTSVPTSFTMETWFKTTTNTGGDLMSFGDQVKVASNNVDRSLYMANTGILVFGVKPASGIKYVDSGSATYNDGAWHLADAVFSSTGGMTLYVDGIAVSSNSTYTASGTLTQGYWRIGYDSLSHWPGAPGANSFGGSFDDTAVYNTALSSAQINAHLGASELAPCTVRTPVDSPYLYYSYNQVSGSSITDSSASGTTGTLSGGTVSNVACTGGASPVLTLASGDTGASAPAAAITGTQPITLETWFNTSSSSGGWLMGLGGTPPALSSTRDRIVYMNNAGQLTYYAYDGIAGRSLTTSASYNDGNWHQVIVTMTAASGPTLGTTIYVDGVQVARDSTLTTGQLRLLGAYWRIGYDNMGGLSTSNTFVGSLDDTAVYLSAMTAAQVTAHFALPR